MSNPTARAAPLVLIAAVALSQSAGQEESRAVYQANVNMVALTFSVTDSRGNYVTGLKPDDVRILEDGIEQKVAAFAEGSGPLLRLVDRAPASSGTSVFILFDTSNRMYSSFPYVCDAIADFVRGLEPADSVAIYTFSKNLSRAAPLTPDHVLARAGLTNAVAGDETALFNSMLLTLRDAAKVPGRKAIVVFSNGPDNVSMIGPHDVGAVAENEGIPIYVVSTQDAARDPVMAGTLQSLTTRTGGKLYWAHNWRNQSRVFTSVRHDISSSYTAYYYPVLNPNEGFRRIHVEMVSRGGKKYQIRARTGYQPPKRIRTATN